MVSRVKALQQMLVQDSEDSFLNYALALEMIKNNQLKEAISILEKLLHRDENYLAAYYQLGKMQEQLSEKNSAIMVYNKGIEIARKQKNNKTLGELAEALALLEE